MSTFDVSAAAYGRFMGRYSRPLADRFVTLVDIEPGQQVLDVGCGPGALTEALAAHLGPEHVSAVDPEATFVAAVHESLPDVDARVAPAEHLPYDDATFDRTLAQLVVQFMADPVAGLREMARVTRPGGIVAASLWDHATGRGPLSQFWQAARDLDPALTGEAGQAGVRRGHLAELFTEAGMPGADADELGIEVEHLSFEDWWEPYTLGVGPAGAYVASLGTDERERLREHCRELLPDAPFAMVAVAWTVVWRRPAST